ncbi:MAG: succinate dehydrogenase [Runella slithyformis]|jgi:succinate dehydrogenase / fumarate reductase, cytochrome b subunit|nr:MAG: succinate dehydrogenase [Runella slithyformis]
MSWITQTLTSSIGKKLVMALSGLFLCTFLIVHLVGNLQVFNSDNGMAFNTYAVFMTTNPLIKTVSYGLYALILIHAFEGLYLAFQNYKARGAQRYAVEKGSANSSWFSRNMAVLGTVLLVFIVVHMSNFWFDYKFGYTPYTQYETSLITGETTAKAYEGPEIKGKMEEFMREESNTRVVIVKDLYRSVVEAFKNPILVIFYVLAMFSVSFHLVHGFKSAFQTLGINHTKYNPILNFLGVGVFGILVPIGFVLMPIVFFLKSL